MKIERKDDEIVIRLPANMSKSYLQDILDYLQFAEITSKSTATPDDLEKLLKTAKKGRWKKIKSEVKEE